LKPAVCSFYKDDKVAEAKEIFSLKAVKAALQPSQDGVADADLPR